MSAHKIPQRRASHHSSPLSSSEQEERDSPPGAEDINQMLCWKLMWWQSDLGPNSKSCVVLTDEEAVSGSKLIHSLTPNTEYTSVLFYGTEADFKTSFLADMPEHRVSSVSVSAWQTVGMSKSSTLLCTKGSNSGGGSSTDSVMDEVVLLEVTTGECPRAVSRLCVVSAELDALVIGWDMPTSIGDCESVRVEAFSFSLSENQSSERAIPKGLNRAMSCCMEEITTTECIFRQDLPATDCSAMVGLFQMGRVFFHVL